MTTSFRCLGRPAFRPFELGGAFEQPELLQGRRFMPINGAVKIMLKRGPDPGHHDHLAIIRRMIARDQPQFQAMDTTSISPDTPFRLTGRGSLVGRGPATAVVAAEARISPPRASAAILAAT